MKTLKNEDQFIGAIMGIGVTLENTNRILSAILTRMDRIDETMRNLANNQTQK